MPFLNIFLNIIERGCFFTFFLHILYKQNCYKNTKKNVYIDLIESINRIFVIIFHNLDLCTQVKGKGSMIVINDRKEKHLQKKSFLSFFR